jgi:uncharacterized protein YlxW (UPF0749 family)
MTRPSGRLMIGLVLALLGFLVIVQLRSQAQEQAFSSLTVQDLTELVANVTTRNNQLREDIAALERQRQAVSAAVQRGDTSATEIRSDLTHVLAWSGGVGVTGAGVSLTVTGPLPPEAVNELVNELRNAGAEAIAIGGTRLVAGVVVGGQASSLLVGGLPLGGPLELDAIGQPETLAGSLTRVGGPLAQLAARYPDATIRVVPQDLLTIPATHRDLMPALGKPRL